MCRNILNIPQKNSLIIALSQAEEAVESLVGLIKGEKSRPVRESGSGLSSSETDFILRELKEMLSLVRAAAGSLGLDLSPETISLRRKILAAVSVIWKDLEESKSSQLKRYGEVHPNLETKLDPQIEKIIAKIMNLRPVGERKRKNA
jgi:hypothetical protein